MKKSEAFDSSLKKIFYECCDGEGWEIEFDDLFMPKSPDSYSNPVFFNEVLNEPLREFATTIKSFISSLLAKQQEENQKIIDGIFEIKEKELARQQEEPAYIGGVNLTTNDNEISNRLAVEDKLQTEFMEFWDEYKPKVGLGDYSDEITRFWFEKMETQKAEIISLIYSMILNKEVDDVEASKIVNKIRNETIQSKIN
jgi:hypothetical protein